MSHPTDVTRFIEDLDGGVLAKGGPGFRLRAMALDAAEQEIAEEFANKIEAELPDLECLLGTFSP